MGHGYQMASIDSVAWLGLEAAGRRADERRLQPVVDVEAAGPPEGRDFPEML